MEMLRGFEPVALFLMIFGALNWGIGLTGGETNVLTDIFGTGTLDDIVYIMIGVAGLLYIPKLLDALHRRRPASAGRVINGTKRPSRAQPPGSVIADQRAARRSWKAHDVGDPVHEGPDAANTSRTYALSMKNCPPV